MAAVTTLYYCTTGRQEIGLKFFAKELFPALGIKYVMPRVGHCGSSFEFSLLFLLLFLITVIIINIVIIIKFITLLNI